MGPYMMTRSERKDHSSAVSFSGTATIARTKNNLKRFEDGELEAWSKRAWDLFDEMYDDAYFVILHDLLQVMPDARLDSHPIKMEQGEWTVVVGVISGTLPNGKRFTGEMCTLTRWKDGHVVEEHIFRDTEPMKKILNESSDGGLK